MYLSSRVEGKRSEDRAEEEEGQAGLTKEAGRSSIGVGGSVGRRGNVYAAATSVPTNDGEVNKTEGKKKRRAEKRRNVEKREAKRSEAKRGRDLGGGRE